MILDIEKIFKSFEGKINYAITDHCYLIGDGDISLNSVQEKSTVFTSNLAMIDSSLNIVLSQLLKVKNADAKIDFLEFSQYLECVNPLNVNNSIAYFFYANILKNFLSAVALGMAQNEVWAGTESKVEHQLMFRNGDFLLPHHILNKTEFENYLFANTKLDTPSSSRHEFGTVYEENGQLYFALNLQIRFK